MMKAHGILKPNEAPKSYSGNVKSEKSHSTSTSSKKRKIGEFADEQAAQDDEEPFVGIVKQDPELDAEELLRVKEEPEDLQGDSGNGDIAEYPLSEMGAQNTYNTDSSTFYDPVIASSLYEPSTAGYDTTANGFADPSIINHPYGFRAARFMEIPPYQSHSHINTLSVPVNQEGQYQENHFTIGD